MVIEFESTADDVLAGQEYLYWKHPGALSAAVRQHRRTYFRVLAVMVGLTGLAWWLMISRGSGGGRLVGMGAAGSVYMIACIAITYVPGWSGRFRRKMRKRIVRMLRESMRRGELQLTGPARMELTADGIDVTSRYATVLYFWTAVTGVTTSSRHVFITLAPQSLLTVPRDAIGDEEAVGAFVRGVLDGAKTAGAVEGPLEMVEV